jgi:hypothetical protein
MAEVKKYVVKVNDRIFSISSSNKKRAVFRAILHYLRSKNLRSAKKLELKISIKEYGEA